MPTHSLYLYSDDEKVLQQLEAQFNAYLDPKNRSSGFDLWVYPSLTDSPTKMSILLSTRVCAIVINSNDYMPDIPAAYNLFARSSLPKTGWFLGNGVGLIDVGYVDELKGFFLKHDVNDRIADHHPESGWQKLTRDAPRLQIVAPDMQKFWLVSICKDKKTWDATLEHFGIVNRGGGFGSTDAINVSPGDAATSSLAHPPQ